jgi:hypothetical protein
MFILACKTVNGLNIIQLNPPDSSYNGLWSYGIWIGGRIEEICFDGKSVVHPGEVFLSWNWMRKLGWSLRDFPWDGDNQTFNYLLEVVFLKFSNDSLKAWVTLKICATESNDFQQNLHKRGKKTAEKLLKLDILMK